MKLYHTKPHPQLEAGYQACLNTFAAERPIPDWRDYHKNAHHLFVLGWERCAEDAAQWWGLDPNTALAKINALEKGRNWYALGSMPAPQPDLLPAARAGWETARAFAENQVIDWRGTLATWFWAAAVGILIVIGVNKIADYATR